jgi:hypothetical protein
MPAALTVSAFPELLADSKASLLALGACIE